MKAYVLLQVSSGEGEKVLQEVRKLSEVKVADRVTGPFDVIAVVEVEGLEGLGALIRRGFQSISGVGRTMTCLSTSRF